VQIESDFDSTGQIGWYFLAGLAPRVIKGGGQECPPHIRAPRGWSPVHFCDSIWHPSASLRAGSRTGSRDLPGLARPQPTAEL